MSNERLHHLLAEYQGALARDPDNPQLLAAVGQVLEELGERDQAGQHYLAAARAYEAMRLYRDAAEACAHVLTIDAANLDAIALLRRLGDDDGASEARPSRRVRDGNPVVVGPTGETLEQTRELLAPSEEQRPGEWFEDEETERRAATRPGHNVSADGRLATPTHSPAQPAATDTAPGKGGKRPRLRARRPKRKVSPLDRTVVDTGQPDTGQPEMGQPEMGQPEMGQPEMGQPQTPQADQTRPIPASHAPASHAPASTGDEPAPLPAPPSVAAKLRGDPPSSARVEGKLPSRRPRRIVSPHDMTEVEAVGANPNSAGPEQAQADTDVKTSAGRRRRPRGVDEADRTQVETQKHPDESSPPARPAAKLKLGDEHRQLARAVSYSRGEIIVREGQAGSDLFIVDAGRVQVSRRLDDSQVALAVLEEGSFFGELGMLGDGQRHATVRAAKASRLLVLTRQQARLLMRDDRVVNRAIRRAYRDRLRETVLAISPLLRSLRAPLADRVLAQGKPAGCGAGKRVIARGDPSRAFFLVLLGRLEVLDDAGERIGEIEEGDFFGHVSLLAGAPAAHEIRTQGFTQLLEMTPAQFAEIVAAEPELAHLIERDAASWPVRLALASG